MAVQRTTADLIASIPASNRWKADKEIDFENTDIRGRVIPQHVGRIAAEMTNWEDTIADGLGLTAADREDIVQMYLRKPSLQRREALSRWKAGLGSQATYRALMEVFVRAGRMDYAQTIVAILKEGAETTEPPHGQAGTTDQLSPNHLLQVLNLVWEARPKYNYIGLALGLPAGTINAMEKSHSYRVDDIFTEMITACLRQGLVTQQKLADAVSSPQVSLEYLKEGILAKKFTASKPTRSTPDPPASGSVGGATGGSGGHGQGTATATPQSVGLQAQTPSNVTSGINVGDGGASPRFSPSMTPDQLEQWLLHEYGDAYKNDISKLKDGLINGVLFLALPDDRELLDDLRLSPAFKRLVRMKVSQLKESSSTPPPTPTPASNGKASLPQTETTTALPLCSTVDLDEEDARSGNVEPDAMEVDEIQAESDVLSAWVPKNVLWKRKTELRVKFLNVIPQEWTYAGSGMNVGNIMSWANEWNLRGGGTIPKFTLVQGADAPSDIRVLFTNNGRRETKLGKRAQKAKYNEATMWLDLHSGEVGDDYKKHIVIHEFGHALGLGHEHQRSDFWKLIKPYINIAKMKKDLKVTDKEFKANWDSDSQFKTGKCTTYDPNSIMHYWFMTDWLKNGYRDQSKVEKDRDSGILPPDEAEALLGVHSRNHSIPLADKPSDMDIQLLKDLYGNTSCTILGPPPAPTQPNTLQHPKNVNRVVSDDGDVMTGPTNRHSQETRLTLRILGSLKSKYGGKPVNIIQQVAPHWQDFATSLDFDPDGNTMQRIDKKNRGDPEACCREMMQTWLRGVGRQPATLKLLVEILEECNLIVLAQQVEEAIPYNS